MSDQVTASGHDPIERKGNETGIVFERIKERRDAYYVEYVPARSGDYFANLILVFLQFPESKKIAKIMESECDLWIQRYAVPLMVTAFDNTDSMIPLDSVRPCDHLIGLVEKHRAVFFWKIIGNEEFPSGPLHEADLLSVYHDIPSTTSQERRQKANDHARSIRFGLIVIAVWVVVVPAFVWLIGFASFYLGVIIVVYSVGKAILHALKLFGYLQSSKRERQKAEEELRMRHHHYHCERNPKAFMQLKLENFENEARERIRKEADNIASGEVATN